VWRRRLSRLYNEGVRQTGVAPSGAAPYLHGMRISRDESHREDRNAVFSRVEIRWLGAVVIAAVLASAVAAMVSDKAVADLLGGDSASPPQQTNADG
jgi:hypothetical protein